MNISLLKKLRKRFTIIKNRKKNIIWYTIYDTEMKSDVSIDYDDIKDARTAYRKNIINTIDKYRDYNRKPIYPSANKKKISKILGLM